MVQSLGFVEEEIWTMLDLKTKCRENNKISVTRFGEISPIWQNFKTIWQLVEGSISVWQTFEAIWENSMCFRANLRCFKWPNIEQTF